MIVGQWKRQERLHRFSLSLPPILSHFFSNNIKAIMYTKETWKKRKMGNTYKYKKEQQQKMELKHK